MSQDPLLQGWDFVKASQAEPPFLGFTSNDLVADWIPPPHSLLHLFHGDQGDKPHSTGQGICLHFRMVVSDGHATPRFVFSVITSRTKE
jgi:hypothetical protein